MRLLLDTHILLWALAEPRRLSAGARDLIADGRNQVFASVVSLFEIAAKRTPLRRTSPALAAQTVAELLEPAGYSLLPVMVAHALAVEGLAPAHKDPFDRLILGQAVAERLHLLTHDESLAAHSDLAILA